MILVAPPGLSTLLVDIFIVICATWASFITYGVIAKNWDVFATDIEHCVWRFVEFEEGREAVGLWLLALHDIILASLIPSKSVQKAKNGSQVCCCVTIPDFEQWVRVFVVAVMLGVLLYATYAWVYYQPLMNKRLNVEHCNGAFGDRSV